MTHSSYFLVFDPILPKYPTISINPSSLLPLIDEFVSQGLISQISIMLFLKNTSIMVY